jgi:hypothetical protein
MKIHAVFCAVMSLSMLAGCPDEELVVSNGVIFGQACYQDGGAPIVNAVVGARSGGVDVPVRRASSTGAYRLEGLPAGSYEVFTTAPVQQPLGTIVIGGAEELVRELTEVACRDIPNTDGGCITGQICNRHTGEVYTQLDVSLNLAGRIVGTAKTDADGNFRVCSLEPGQAILEVAAPYSRSFPVVIGGEGSSTVFDLAQECNADDNVALGNLFGEFCDPATSGALQGAPVSVQGPSVPVAGVEPVDFQELTDTLGTFYLSGLYPGDYNVTVGSFQTTVTIVARQTSTVTDVVNCGAVPPVGRVNGQSCEWGAQVELVNSQDVIFGAVTSSAVGVFEFVDVPPGVYTVRIYGIDATRLVGPFEVVAYQATSAIAEPADNCGGDGTCEQIPLDRREVSDGRILFVVDKSGSMGCPAEQPDCYSKWDFTREALTGLMQGTADVAPLPPAVEVGMVLYPGETTTSDAIQPNCTTGTILEPLSASSRPAIAARLAATIPAGGTPTAASMAVARNAVQAALQGAGAARPLAVVLATDGAPNCACPGGECQWETDNSQLQTCRCTSGVAGGAVTTDCNRVNCINDTATYAELTAVSGLGVDTYVIGTGVANYADVMNTMATAGGTARAGAVQYYPVEQATELNQALAEITSRILSCSLLVPGDGVLNGGDVVVTVSIDGVEIPRDTTRGNGWDFLPGAERNIELYGAACDRVNGSNSNVIVERCEG